MPKIKIDAHTDLTNIRLSGNLKDDVDLFRQALKNDDTVIFREFENRFTPSLRGYIIYTEVLVNNLIIDQNVVKPLITARFEDVVPLPTLADTVFQKIVHGDEVKTKDILDELIKNILIGDTVVLLEGSRKAIAVNSKKYNTRSVSIPETENSVNGPKESFNELIVSNVGLIRRKIKNPNLKFKMLEIGKMSKTRICISYIDGLADQSILDELMSRLNSFEIDSALDISYLAEIIRDAPLSPFKTIGSTERPDVVAAKLLEGRIAVLCDGTPFALTLPFLFLENFQAAEDYYTHYFFSTFVRILRYLAFFITVSLPAMYVALICYHKEMIPKNLLISIVNSRNSVPFPAVVEMVILLVLFDLIREAGVRLPKPIGGTISTVGAIVLGQSIVTAKIVSAEMIIIVAICGITSFLTPKLEQEIIVLRILFLILSATLGIYGFSLAALISMVHMASLRSFGIEYMGYLTALKPQQTKDVYVRSPWWTMRKRPEMIQRQNLTRLRRTVRRKR